MKLNQGYCPSTRFYFFENQTRHYYWIIILSPGKYQSYFANVMDRIKIECHYRESFFYPGGIVSLD